MLSDDRKFFGIWIFKQYITQCNAQNLVSKIGLFRILILHKSYCIF
jgi:hypothetical protein